MAGFPRYRTGFTASWNGIGDPDETLRVFWTDDMGQPGNVYFTVGTDVFLENPANMSQVPEDQLLSSIRMSAILAGEILPGTQEYLAAMGEQSSMNFQCIIGNAKIKTITSVLDSLYGPPGTVYDIEFMKVNASSNVKTVRADAWALSQYNNGDSNFAYAANCVPGMLHKVLGLKASQLGAENSANRNAVVDAIAVQKFWI
jgi:hypothetical protein